MKRFRFLVGLLVLGGGGILVSVACSTPSSDARIGIDGPPEDATNWHPVAQYLGQRCGSLDCHGNAQRNFVIWNCAGLRADPSNYPNCSLPKQKTTDDEYDRTYRSLVGLEPAVMSSVVSGGGQDPELLTFIRKARGMESHKGNELVVPGDPQDLCMTSWLTGTTDLASCACAQTIAENGGPAGAGCAQDAGAE
jgi:hypothetical protein